jgi:hypothetical protein
MARFITIEVLKEVAHNMDTCTNESFNNTIAWLAPKNQLYCGTNSLKNRISIAIGITALGTIEFYWGLFGQLGIHLTDDVLHFLKIKLAQRQN